MDLLEKLQNHLEGLSPYEMELEKQTFHKDDIDIPQGWVSIEDHLPMFLACDLMDGYTEYKVKFKDDTEGVSYVSDHTTWYYYAKENNITHWFNKL